MRPLCRGVVARFDATEGLGAIELDEGGEVGFHATQLASGTRRIDVGTVVFAELVAGHAGAFEATCVTVA